MLWIKKYAMIKSSNGEYRIVSMEDSVCPCCGGMLRSRDSRVRWCRDSDGEKYRIRIRRLRCKICGKIHAELPDSLIPYRRYSYDTIKNSCTVMECSGAEAATIRAWKIWLSGMKFMSEQYDKNNMLGEDTGNLEIDMEDMILLFCQIKNGNIITSATPNKESTPEFSTNENTDMVCLEIQ